MVVVDPDEVEPVGRWCGCIDDDGGESAVPGRLDQGVLTGEGVQKKAVDGGVRTPEPLEAPFSG